MSARVESAPIRGSLPTSIVLVTAIVVALGIGAAAGTIITKAVDDAPAATSVGAPLWDTQKLEAMAGRVLYQPVVIGSEVATTAKPSSTQGQPAYVGWDAYKLEAMEGRVLAAGVGAEDPPVKPHLPKRPPRG